MPPRPRASNAWMVLQPLSSGSRNGSRKVCTRSSWQLVLLTITQAAAMTPVPIAVRQSRFAPAMKKMLMATMAYTPAVPRSGSMAIRKNPGATSRPNGMRPFQKLLASLPRRSSQCARYSTTASLANSAGCNVPTPGMMIQRWDPLISAPMPGTRTATSSPSVMTQIGMARQRRCRKSSRMATTSAVRPMPAQTSCSSPWAAGSALLKQDRTLDAEQTITTPMPVSAMTASSSAQDGS